MDRLSREGDEIMLGELESCQGLVVFLNGKDICLPYDKGTLAKLVGSLGLESKRIAIEVNGELVEETEWEGTVLGARDRIEIVHFVGGG